MPQACSVTTRRVSEGSLPLCNIYGGNVYASVIWCTQETCADDATPVLMRCYFWGDCDATGCTAGHMPQECSVTARRAGEGSLPLCSNSRGGVYAPVICCAPGKRVLCV